ncbi:MAG TPA: Ig-like domain-containing protein, partial [Gemmatimonadales bacterium]|nr:Ig-like domain-containing protein [Gemmatimonadales bacterium]
MKAAFVTLLLASAGATSASAQAVAEVQVTPDELRLETGQDTRLFAAAYDPQGRIIATANITYLSSDTAVATVTADGSVSGHAAGTALIEAVAGGRRDTAQVTVTSSTAAPTSAAAPPVPVSAILLEPASLALIPLEPARLIAHVETSDSSTPPVVPLTWSSADTRIAAVDRDGVVVGTGPGSTTITATSANGVSGSASVS